MAEEESSGVEVVPDPTAGEGSMDAAAAYARSLQTQEQNPFVGSLAAAEASAQQGTAVTANAGDTPATTEREVTERATTAATAAGAETARAERASFQDREQTASRSTLRSVQDMEGMGILFLFQLILAFFTGDTSLIDREQLTQFSNGLGLGPNGLDDIVERIGTGEITRAQGAYEAVRRVDLDRVDYEALSGVQIDSETRHDIEEAFESDGAELLVEAAEALGITDERQQAYILATVYHETGGTMAPIREAFADSDEQAIRRLQAHANSGEASARYAANMREYSTVDPQTGEAYFGRGFVQLTWADNYRESGAVLTETLTAGGEDAQRMETFLRSSGVSDELLATIRDNPDWLYENPDAMIENAAISAVISIEGMQRDGGFTGRGNLDHFFSDSGTDAIAARGMINGDVEANGRMVAGYYDAFYRELYSGPGSTQLYEGGDLALASLGGQGMELTGYGANNAGNRAHITAVHREAVARSPVYDAETRAELAEALPHLAPHLDRFVVDGRIVIDEEYAVRMNGFIGELEANGGTFRSADYNMVNVLDYRLQNGGSPGVLLNTPHLVGRAWDGDIDGGNLSVGQVEDLANSYGLGVVTPGDYSARGTGFTHFDLSMSDTRFRAAYSDPMAIDTPDQEMLATTDETEVTTDDELAALSPASTSDELAPTDATPVASLTTAFGDGQGTDQIAAAAASEDTAPPEVVVAADSTTRLPGLGGTTAV